MGKKNKQKRFNWKQPKYLIDRNPKIKFRKKKLKEDPFHYLTDETVLKSKKLCYDNRVGISLTEVHETCMDVNFASKKQKKYYQLHLHKRIYGSEPLSQHSIQFSDISYFLFVIKKGTLFPGLNRIHDPYHKYKSAIVEVGTKEDNFPEKIQKRDLKFIEKEYPYEGSYTVYRIKRRVYERFVYASVIDFVMSDIDESCRKSSSIYFPLKASNNGEKVWQHYLLVGYAIMKNSDAYQLFDIDKSKEIFRIDITNHEE